MQVTEGHRAGPVPPCIAAVRGRAYNTIKENARLAHDPIIALLGELEVESFDQAFKLLKAEFDSDDRPDSILQEAYNAFISLALPNGALPAQPRKRRQSC
eukprot:8853746-Pyramimonas_sp.AAC.1